MVKLQAAKCPSCGADIQVNDKLENTICQYCGSTVLVQDAIEKYKVEISGNVKVEGIKGRDDKLNQAKKHHKYDELDKAKKLINEIIKDDNFDTEAYCELVKIDLDNLSKIYNTSKCPEVQWKNYQIMQEMLETYERIEKIDEDKIANKELKDYMEKIEQYKAYQKELDDDEFTLSKLYNSKHRDLADKAAKIGGEAQNKLLEAFNETFGMNMRNYSSLKEDYCFRKDGTLVESNKTTYYETSLPVHSAKEMEQRINEYFSKAEAIVNKSAKKGLLKVKFSLGGWVILSIISGIFCFALGGFTISLFVEKHIVGGIAFIIFIDSWLFIYPFYFFIGALGNVIGEIKHGKQVKETLK